MIMESVVVEDWGLVPFAEAWTRQTAIHKHLVQQKLDYRGRLGDMPPQPHRLVLLEHMPVYTLGKSGKPEHLLLSEDGCRDLGIDYLPINRGGDITFHGPGQLVAYPILDLDCFFTDVHRYVRSLEEVVIRTLGDFGLSGQRDSRYTGVWLQAPPPHPLRKVCAIGVHLSRWVTLHGLALNVHTNLDFFNHIVPCGIRDDDKAVTSMAIAANTDVAMGAVKQSFLAYFAEVFGCHLLTPTLTDNA
jgi:lipoyl(octanoyl) transferase